jgi:hypothetical protein
MNWMAARWLRISWLLWTIEESLTPEGSSAWRSSACVSTMPSSAFS